MNANETEGLYRKYGPMVLRRCRQLLRDEELAVDALQDVFVQLVSSAPKLENRAPSSLLYQMANHVCLDRLRRQRRRPETPAEELLLEIADQSDLEESLGAQRILDRLFGREPPSTRSIAVMHLYDGMTLEEVAAESGLSVSGVRKRLRGLRAKLRQQEAA